MNTLVTHPVLILILSVIAVLKWRLTFTLIAAAAISLMLIGALSLASR